MYCGKCSGYIPEMPGIVSCPLCGVSIQETQKLREEIVLKKQEADKKASEERRRSQKSYSYLEAVPLSFFSRHLYRDVLRRWSGSGMLFLAFTSALWMIPISVWLQVELDRGFDRVLAPFIQQIPDLSVEGGRLRYQGPDPYPVKNVKGQIGYLFTRAEGPVDFNNIPAYVLITPTQIATKNTSNGFNLFNIPPTLKFAVNSKSALYWSRQFLRWAAFVIYPVVWAATLMMLAFFILLFSLVGKLAAWVLRIPSDFQNIFRLAAVAFTPCMMLYSLTFVWRSLDDLMDGFMLIGPVLFMVMGLWFNREPRPKKAKSA